MSRSRMVAALAALAAVAVPAAPAVADDASVYAAWTSRDADAERLGRELARAQRIWERSNFRRTRPLLRALRDSRELTDQVAAAVSGEAPSSGAGGRGKELALSSLAFLKRSFGALGSAVRYASRGRPRAALRSLRRWERLLEDAVATERRAARAFREAGVAPSS